VLCLQWLAGLDLGGRTVIDYGCGSGILAIAAAHLGAVAVYGVDHDPQAVLATGENARLNKVAHSVHVTAQPPGEVQVLVANILANALHELAPLFAELSAPGGLIGLSGILVEQAARLSARYSAAFEMNPPVELDGWILLTGQRRDRA
jgi:ribosomal protein L11 methyltransferase